MGEITRSTDGTLRAGKPWSRLAGQVCPHSHDTGSAPRQRCSTPPPQKQRPRQRVAGVGKCKDRGLWGPGRPAQQLNYFINVPRGQDALLRRDLDALAHELEAHLIHARALLGSRGSADHDGGTAGGRGTDASGLGGHAEAGARLESLGLHGSEPAGMGSVRGMWGGSHQNETLRGFSLNVIDRNRCQGCAVRARVTSPELSRSSGWMRAIAFWPGRAPPIFVPGGQGAAGGRPTRREPDPRWPRTPGGGNETLIFH